MQTRPFRVVGHTADIAVVVSGDSLKQLLENAALALYYLTIDKPLVGSIETRRVEIDSIDDAALLIDWLNELIYLLFVDRLACWDFEFDDIGDGGAVAHCHAARLSPDTRLKREIKAATYHTNLLSYSDGGLVARVVFDV